MVISIVATAKQPFDHYIIIHKVHSENVFSFALAVSVSPFAFVLLCFHRLIANQHVHNVLSNLAHKTTILITTFNYKAVARALFVLS